MSKTPRVLTEKKSTLSERLNGSSYQKLADALSEEVGCKVSKGAVYKFINKPKYNPVSDHLREAFDLPDMQEVIVIVGEVPPGTQVVGAALVCAGEDCGNIFISNHPRRRRCFLCSPYRGQRRL